VQLRRQMLERMQQREKMRNQLARADSNVNDKSPFMSGLGQSQQMALKIEARSKVDIFEIAFRKMREATGVSDVNEVIQKIVSQESSMDNLISLSKENQAKIESLKELRRTAKIKVEGVKYSSMSGGYRRMIVDDHEDQLADSMTRLDRSKAKFERLTKAILSVKSGVGHLQDMLDPFFEELGTRAVALDDSAVVEVLRECELCLVKLNNRLEVGEEGRSRSRLASKLDCTYGASPTSGQIKSVTSSDMNIGATDSPDKSGNIIVHQITTNTSPVVRPYNQRIELTIGDEDDSNPKEQSPTSKPDSDLDEEEFTREKVKRASSQILARVTRKKGKPKK
jgi:coiled-coil domain-containing protein 151